MKLLESHRAASKAARARPLAPSGFTLIEVMLAIAIIGIGMLTMSMALYDSIHSNDSSQNYTSLVTMIDDWTERLQGIERSQAQLAFGAFPSCAGGVAGFAPIAVGDIMTPGEGGFNQILVSPEGDMGPPLRGQGVVISYDLFAYCTPDQVQGAANSLVPNSYQLLGRAYLVENVAAGAGGSYKVLGSVNVDSMFSDRPPSFTGF